MTPFAKAAALLGALVWIGPSLAPAQVPESVAKSKPGGASGAKAAKPLDPIAVALLAGHNREREKAEKGLLKLSEKLLQAASVHAKDMAEHETLDHTGSDKSTVAERAKRTGYPYILVGENIAEGQKTVDEVMETWMESPSHRENIMADFTEMGAARVKDKNGVSYWCVTFGTPIPQLKPKEAAADVVKYLNEDRKKRDKPLLKAETRIGKAAMEISSIAGQERLVQDRRRPIQA